jgi:hypothetical protein
MLNLEVSMNCSDCLFLGIKIGLRSTESFLMIKSILSVGTLLKNPSLSTPFSSELINAWLLRMVLLIRESKATSTEVGVKLLFTLGKTSPPL